MPLQGCIKSLRCLSILFVGIAFPPVQCSKNGLKMRNKKGSSLIQPCNGIVSYFHGYLLNCLVTSPSWKLATKLNGVIPAWRPPRSGTRRRPGCSRAPQWSPCPGWQFNIKYFSLSFGFENLLSFSLRFPTLIKSSKMASLDMSQNNNGISSRFFKPKLKPKCVLLNCLPGRRARPGRGPRRAWPGSPSRERGGRRR